MSTTLTDEEMEHWLKLDQAATPGPWERGKPYSEQINGPEWPICIVLHDDDRRPLISEYEAAHGEADAALIAAYRTAVPRLVERLKELESGAGARAIARDLRQSMDHWKARAEAAEADRDEWRAQHENALACWKVDNANILARAELAESDSVRTAEALIDMRRRAETAEAEVERVRDLEANIKQWIDDNRVLVREIERLRGDLEAATARVRELEDQANREGMTPHETFCFAAGRTKGAADERAAVVSWLRGRTDDQRSLLWTTMHTAANAIEAGEHRKERP